MNRPIFETRHDDPYPPLLARLDYAELYRLLRIHLKQMCSAWVKRTGETLDELTHDATSLVILKVPQFKGKSRFGTWAHVVALNLCRSKAEKRRRRLRLATIVPLTPAIMRSYRGAALPAPRNRQRSCCSKGHPIEWVGKRRLCRTCRQAGERRRYRLARRKITS